MMALDLKVRSGRWPKPLDKLKTDILRELAIGPKNWKDLWENETIQNEARSRKLLQKALRELQEEGLVKEDIISHKNRKYSLTKPSMNFIDLRNIEIQLLKGQILFEATKTKQFKDNNNLLISVMLSSLTVISSSDVSIRPYAETWFNFYLMPIVFDNFYKLKLSKSHNQ